MANPALREEVFETTYHNGEYIVEQAMTPLGTLSKTSILGLLLAITFAYSWYLIQGSFLDKAALLTNIGLWGGLITSMIIIFGPKNNYLAISTSMYAMFEGLFLGSTSAIINKIYPGVATQAALGTILVVFGMLILYSTKLIKVTEKFNKIVLLSTFSVFVLFMIDIILNVFHISIPGIFSNSPIGIAFSVIIIIIAAFNLIVDYEFINRYSGNAPKYFEWYGAFSLMVTIVWLYIEILRLFAKINSRD